MGKEKGGEKEEIETEGKGGSGRMEKRERRGRLP